jgi:hypothetical protein
MSIWLHALRARYELISSLIPFLLEPKINTRQVGFLMRPVSVAVDSLHRVESVVAVMGALMKWNWKITLRRYKN